MGVDAMNDDGPWALFKGRVLDFLCASLVTHFSLGYFRIPTSPDFFVVLLRRYHNSDEIATATATTTSQLGNHLFVCSMQQIAEAICAFLITVLYTIHFFEVRKLYSTHPAD